VRNPSPAVGVLLREEAEAARIELQSIVDLGCCKDRYNATIDYESRPMTGGMAGGLGPGLVGDDPIRIRRTAPKKGLQRP
jgi:hypothetical protein